MENQEELISAQNQAMKEIQDQQIRSQCLSMSLGYCEKMTFRDKEPGETAIKIADEFYNWITKPKAHA